MVGLVGGPAHPFFQKQIESLSSPVFRSSDSVSDSSEEEDPLAEVLNVLLERVEALKTQVASLSPQESKTLPEQFYLQTRLQGTQQKHPIHVQTIYCGIDAPVKELWTILEADAPGIAPYLGYTRLQFFFLGRGSLIMPQGLVPFKGSHVNGFKVVVPEDGEVAQQSFTMTSKSQYTEHFEFDEHFAIMHPLGAFMQPLAKLHEIKLYYFYLQTYYTQRVSDSGFANHRVSLSSRMKYTLRGARPRFIEPAL